MRSGFRGWRGRLTLSRLVSSLSVTAFADKQPGVHALLQIIVGEPSTSQSPTKEEQQWYIALESHLFS